MILIIYKTLNIIILILILIKTNYYGLGEMNILNKICIKIIFDMIYSAFDMVFNPYKIYENYNMDYNMFINLNKKIKFFSALI